MCLQHIIYETVRQHSIESKSKTPLTCITNSTHVIHIYLIFLSLALVVMVVLEHVKVVASQKHPQAYDHQTATYM